MARIATIRPWTWLCRRCAASSIRPAIPDQPPVKSGAALCDFIAGIHLYGAIMTALYERERTGNGRVVEVSMQDAIYSSLASNLGMLHARGEAAPRAPATGTAASASRRTMSIRPPTAMS